MIKILDTTKKDINLLIEKSKQQKNNYFDLKNKKIIICKNILNKSNNSIIYKIKIDNLLTKLESKQINKLYDIFNINTSNTFSEIKDNKTIELHKKYNI